MASDQSSTTGDLTAWGWAPGEYAGATCQHCGIRHGGYAKGSWRCEPCARAARDAEAKRADWPDLKHCPCCGSAAEFHMVPHEAPSDENPGGEWIECIVCGLTTPMLFSVPDDAKPRLAEKWNRRVPQ